MRLTLFGGLRPFTLKTAVRDVFAGVTLASMNIPQVLGYARIAGMPVISGLYTVLLPLVAFAAFGSSRHLVVAANSATAVHLLKHAVPHGGAGEREVVALVGMVALLTAGDPVPGMDLQAGVPRRLPLAYDFGRVSHRCRVSGRDSDAE